MISFKRSQLCNLQILLAVYLIVCQIICDAPHTTTRIKKLRPRNTSGILEKLRELMKKENLDAYIVENSNPHQTETTADHDKRVQYVTGFLEFPCAPRAIIKKHHAYLFTCDIHVLQDTYEDSGNWKLMEYGKQYFRDTLSIKDRIGFDSWRMSYKTYDWYFWSYKPIEMNSNLVDIIWNNQPPLPCNSVIPHPLKYTGLKSGIKVNNIRKKMAEKSASLLFMSQLDDIAWTLNLRGSDVEFDPVFFSFLAITKSDVVLFIDESKISQAIHAHFQNEGLSIFIKPYDDVKPFLRNWLLKHKNKKVFVDEEVNVAISNIIPSRQIMVGVSPVSIMRSVKTKNEIKGMIDAHLKDAVVLCRYFSWLEKNVKKRTITEMSGAKQLEKFRTEMEDFMGLSFPTISAAGPNAYNGHYHPTAETNRPITVNELYLCDSGGHYKHGTTDATRTLHFGTPTDSKKDYFTRILKGVINVTIMKFSSNTKISTFDTMAKKFLRAVGCDYSHCTGHGVGAYLNVHEAPSIGKDISDGAFNNLQEGMFLAVEPGYYEKDKFGIRIENVVQIVKSNKPKQFTFETVTLVPIQASLINLTMLTPEEVSFLNDYHKACREKVEPLLKQLNDMDAVAWLLKETKPIG